jgi:hypothetical protein
VAATHALLALLLAAMVMVLAARAVLLFMLAWETMALSAYLLILYEGEQRRVRRDGLLYLVITHVGALALLGMFLSWGRAGPDLTFASLALASPTLRWERIPLLGSLWTKNAERFPANVRVGDIVRGLPVAERSCRGVYASHVLEHLALDEFHRALDNTLKILGEGGIFRLVVPDLEWAAREYVRRLDATRDPTASDFLMRETYLGTPRRARGPVGLVYRWLSTSSHLWMWDEASLAQALTAHGFRAVRRCQFGDCEDPLFARVEDRERFVHAVAMEARR